MAISVLQHKVASAPNSTGSVTVTLDAAPTPGNVLVLGIQASDVSSVPESFVPIVSVSAVRVAYRVVEQGDPASVTVSVSGENGTVVSLIELSGVYALNPVLGFNNGTASSSVTTATMTVSSYTTPTNDAIAIAFLGVVSASRTFLNEWTNGFSRLWEQVGWGTRPIATAGFRIEDFTGSPITTSESWNQSGEQGPWAMIVLHGSGDGIVHGEIILSAENETAIVDESGSPIAGATVLVIDRDTSEVVDTDTTDQNGGCLFSGLAPMKEHLIVVVDDNDRTSQTRIISST